MRRRDDFGVRREPEIVIGRKVQQLQAFVVELLFKVDACAGGVDIG